MKIKKKAKTYWNKPEYRKTVLGSIYTILLTLLTLYCMTRIFSDNFEYFKMGKREYIVISLEIIVLSAIGLLRKNTKRNILLFLGVIILICLGEWLIFHYTWDEDTIEGYKAIGMIVIREINLYFKTSYKFKQYEYKSVLDAILIVVFPVIGLYFYVIDWMKKNWLILMLPTLALIMVMMVDRKPGYITFILFGFCILLNSSAGWIEIFGRKKRESISLTVSPLVMELVVIAGVLVLVSLFKLPIANGILSKREGLISAQNKAEKNVQDIIDHFTKEDHSIDNHTPEYDEKTMFSLKVNSKVTSAVYLADFKGDNYVNGEWITEENPEDFDYQSIYNNLYDLLLDKNGSYRAMTMEISYVGLKNKNVYAPYGTYLGKDSALTVGSDLLLNKPKKTKKSKIGYVNGISSNKVRRIAESNGNEDNVIIDKYNEYVLDSELGINEDVPSAIELGDLLKRYVHWSIDSNESSYSYEIKVYEDGTVIYTQPEGSEELTQEEYAKLNEYNITTDIVISSVREMGTSPNNEYRYNAARLVQNIFAENYVYSTKFAPVPNGKDAVEYFLSTSKKGYCVHFASAGVLLLREMGVPARYVAGYLAPAEDFRRLPDKTYYTEIKDSSAHAWVEIYLDGIGWVPFEMTPGSGDNVLTKSQKKKSENTDKDTASSTETQTEKESQAETESQTEKETQTETQKETESQTETQTETKNNSSTEAKGDGSGLSKAEQKAEAERAEYRAFVKKVITWLVAILGVMILIFAGIGAYIGWIKSQENKFTRAIADKEYRLAVKLINRRIVNKLRSNPENMASLNKDMAGIRHKGFRDEDVSRLLKKHFEGGENDLVDKYMDIVRKVAFSDCEITKEEADVCFILYGVFKKKK